MCEKSSLRSRSANDFRRPNLAQLLVLRIRINGTLKKVLFLARCGTTFLLQEKSDHFIARSRRAGCKYRNPGKTQFDAFKTDFFTARSNRFGRRGPTPLCSSEPPRDPPGDVSDLIRIAETKAATCRAGSPLAETADNETRPGRRFLRSADLSKLNREKRKLAPTGTARNRLLCCARGRFRSGVELSSEKPALIGLGGADRKAEPPQATIAQGATAPRAARKGGKGCAAEWFTRAARRGRWRKAILRFARPE